MKKHNESKSIKGIRLNKRKILCKVLSFTMIFVMLFCISASADYIFDIEDEIAKIKDSNGEYKDITASVRMTADTDSYNYVHFYIISTSEKIKIETQEINFTIQYGNDTYDGKITINESEIFLRCSYFLNKYDYTTIVSSDNAELCEEIKQYYKQIKDIDYGKDVTLVLPSCYTLETPPVYEGFMGNARGLFDLIFDSMQSIFNWFVSPNVIVFFGLGIILSLTTVGILIARRFFWGR